MALKAVDPFGLQDSGGAPGWDPDDSGKGGSEGGPGVDIAAPDIGGSEAATAAVKLVGVVTSGPAAGLGTSCDSSSCIGENSDPLTAPGFALGVTAVRAAVAAPRVAMRVAESLALQIKGIEKSILSALNAGDDSAAAVGRAMTQGLDEALAAGVPRFELTMPKVGLPGDAFVVRGGVATPEQIARGIGPHRDVPGLVGFSAQSRAGASVEELAATGGLGGGPFPHRQVSVSTVDKLRCVGCDVVASPGGGANHVTVTPGPASPVDISRQFTPRPNPARSR
jgi:hypothetical protein